MFSLSAKNFVKSRSIILDVQSGLVRGSIVEFRHGDKSKINCVITKAIPPVPTSDDKLRMVNEILKVANDVVKNLLEMNHHGNIDTVHYILSSPWIFSELKNLKVDFPKETKISQATIDSVVKEQMSKNTMSADTQHIEVKICEIKLNGYTMEDFDGKVAKNLEIFLYNSYGSRDFLNKLSNTVQNLIYIKIHEYHSALLLQYSALRITNQKHDYIYVHVHSELTDVVVVKNNLCKYTYSFPFGSITLLRKIAQMTNQSIEASDSFITLYQSDKLNEQEKNNAKKIIDPLLASWTDLCLKSLSQVMGDIYIPRTVFLTVHSHFEVFKYALLFNNDLNFDIISYDNIETKDQVEFDKTSSQSILMRLYTLVIANMI